MSKMLKFKRYLTFGDAAQYLTKKLDEEVTTLDVERLLLDGHIAASVITNDWHCFFLNATNTNDAAQSQNPSLIPAPDRVPDDIINGIYSIDIAEIESTRGYITIELETGVKAACYEITQKKLNNTIKKAPKENSNHLSQAIDESIQRLLDDSPQADGTSLQESTYQKPSIDSQNLVIKPSDLLAFVAKANDDTPEKPLDYRERDSMERIILTLAKAAKYNLKEPFKAAATLQAEAASFAIELPRSKDNIAQKLKAAARHDTHN
jgi:hypothetical protein